MARTRNEASVQAAVLALQANPTLSWGALARKLGVHETTIWRWRQSDPALAALMEEIRQTGLGALASDVLCEIRHRYGTKKALANAKLADLIAIFRAVTQAQARQVQVSGTVTHELRYEDMPLEEALTLLAERDGARQRRQGAARH